MTAMPFAPDTLTLHVVSFFPATDDGGVGGFDWSTEAYIDDVIAVYRDTVANVAIKGAATIVRHIKVTDHPWSNWTNTAYLQALDTCPDEMEVLREEITLWLDENLDRWEDTDMAQRQFVPKNADPDRIPSGGVVSWT